MWSIYLKSIVILSTILFICIFGYFFCLRSTLEKKEKIYLDLLVLKKDLNSKLDVTSKYSCYREKIKKIKDQFDLCSQQGDAWKAIVKKAQPTRINILGDCKLSNYIEKYLNAKSMDSRNAVVKLILYLLNNQLSTQLFQTNQINILFIKNKKFINLLQVEVKLSSSKNNIFHLLREIYKLKKFILIEDFRWVFFNRNSNNHKQNIIFSLNFYLPYIRGKDLLLTFPRIKKIMAMLVFKKSNLEKYSLDKIGMSGFLSSKKNQKWGFVRLPNKQIYKVKLGDYLGLERGLIIGIYDQKIIVQINSLKKK